MTVGSLIRRLLRMPIDSTVKIETVEGQVLVVWKIGLIAPTDGYDPGVVTIVLGEIE